MRHFEFPRTDFVGTMNQALIDSTQKYNKLLAEHIKLKQAADDLLYLHRNNLGLEGAWDSEYMRLETVMDEISRLDQEMGLY
jgi:hypothetical protein